jgi:RNA polymerase sigma-70 factor (ECF subfamily)
MTPALDDAALVERLRARDEEAFRELVRRYQATLLNVVRPFVPSRAVAEEVVQETWLGVFQGIDRFEGRSSFKTWLVRIAMNRAKTRGARESRSVPESSLVGPDDDSGPTVPLERFAGPAHRGHWAAPIETWAVDPDAHVSNRETIAVVDETINALPLHQREVVTLRDKQGWSAGEVCDVLGISEINQRVLLHRARAKVRAAVEAHLAESRAS